MSKKYFDLTISEEYLQKIGKISAFHSAADHFFRFTVQILMGTNQFISNVLLYRKQTNELLNLIEKLLRKYNNDVLLSEFKKWRNEFKENCQDKRNEYIHSVWSISGNQTEIFRLMGSAENFSYKIDEVNLEALSSVISDYGELLFRYNSILKKIAMKEKII